MRRAIVWAASVVSALLLVVALSGCGVFSPEAVAPDAAFYLLPPPTADEIPPDPINWIYDANGNRTGYASVGTTPLVAGWGNSSHPMEVVGAVEAKVVKRADGHVILTLTYTAEPGWEFIPEKVGDSPTHVLVESYTKYFGTKIVPGDATVPYADPGSTSTRQVYTIDLTILAQRTTFDWVTVASKVYRIFIAAHAEMCSAVLDVKAFDALLPSDPVSIKLVQPGVAKGGYFDATVADAGDFDGLYKAWCVDPSRSAVADWSKAMLVSSYSDDIALLGSLLGNAANLDVLNYLLNTDWASLLPAALAAKLDYLDLQVAIWRIIDLAESVYAPTTVFDDDVVDWICEYAMFQGEGFVPGADGVVAVVADPNLFVPGGSSQIVILEFPARALHNRCETAWGYGFRVAGYNGNDPAYPRLPGDWSMYFTFDYKK